MQKQSPPPLIKRTHTTNDLLKKTALLELQVQNLKTEVSRVEDSRNLLRRQNACLMNSLGLREAENMRDLKVIKK